MVVRCQTRRRQGRRRLLLELEQDEQHCPFCKYRVEHRSHRMRHLACLAVCPTGLLPQRHPSPVHRVLVVHPARTTQPGRPCPRHQSRRRHQRRQRTVHPCPSSPCLIRCATVRPCQHQRPRRPQQRRPPCQLFSQQPRWLPLPPPLPLPLPLPPRRHAQVLPS